MFAKRERFDRTDVPSSPAAGMMLAVGALVFIAVGLLVGFRVASVLSSRDISLADRSLNKALDAQGEQEIPEGFQASTDIFDETLILTVDDLSSSAPVLTSAELLSINVSTGAATVVNVPLNTRVSNDSGTSMLQSMCAGSGTASCVVPFSKASTVHLTHVIVSSTDIWSKFDELRGMGERSIVLSSPEAFATLRTDMSNDELMNLVERIGTIGTANIARIDMPYTDGTLEDGTGVSVIDDLELRLALGLLLQPAPEEPPAEEEPSEEAPSDAEESYDEGYYDYGYDYDYDYGYNEEY
jgi:hypothetical protein